MALYKQIGLPFQIKKKITGYLSLSKNIVNDIEGYYRNKSYIKFLTNDDLNRLIKRYISRSEPRSICNTLKRSNEYNTNIKILKQNLDNTEGIYTFLDKIINRNPSAFRLLFGLFNNGERESVITCAFREGFVRYQFLNSNKDIVYW